MLLWNQKDLPQPPTYSYKSTTKDLDLTKLRSALKEGVKHFKDDKFLTSEAAILSRILYRMKTKFRSSKDFKLLEKLSRSLDNYFQTHLIRHITNVLHMTPCRYQKDTYLPTKNMLHYVLVRLQGSVKLMERMYDTCLLIASDLNKRLHIGHFWKLFLILFALVSRLSILIKFNTKFLCELYGKLLPHSYKLRNTGMSMIPEGYIFPSDLRIWLGVPWVYEEEFVDLTFEPANEIMNFFNLVDDDDDDILFCDEYILLDDEDKQIENDFNKLSPIKDTITRNRMRGFSINEDDIGEEIADIIELNDTIADHEDKEIAEENENNEENCEDVNLHVVNNDIQMDDIEEISLSANNNTVITPLNNTESMSYSQKIKNRISSKILNKNIVSNSKKSPKITNKKYINRNNDNSDVNSDDLADKSFDIEENSVIQIPDTPIEEQQNIEYNEVIILDDTIDNNSLFSGNNSIINKSNKKSSIKKKKFKNKNAGDSVTKDIETVLQEKINLSQKKGKDKTQNQTNTETKRKLEFDEVISNKKSKHFNETSFKEEKECTISNLPLKRNPFSKSNIKNKKKKSMKNQTGRTTTKDLSIDENFIFLDPDVNILVTPKTKSLHTVSQEETLSPKNVRRMPTKLKSKKNKQKELLHNQITLINESMSYETPITKRKTGSQDQLTETLFKITGSGSSTTRELFSKEESLERRRTLQESLERRRTLFEINKEGREQTKKAEKLTKKQKKLNVIKKREERANKKRMTSQQTELSTPTINSKKHSRKHNRKSLKLLKRRSLQRQIRKYSSKPS